MQDLKVIKLQVQNFRNLNPDVFEFIPSINCIFGPNGNGKTNLLEVLFFLFHKKSFRKNTDFAQIVNIEGSEQEIRVSSLLQSHEEQFPYSAKIYSDREEWHLNNKPHKGKIGPYAIFVNPFDSYLFHTSGSFRRQWIDNHLSYLDKDYKKALLNFQKALRFRNSLLSKGMSSSSKVQLLAIDEQVALYSEQITKARKAFIEELNQHLTETFKNIFSELHHLTLTIDSSLKFASAQELFQIYREREPKDFGAGHTTRGVHRDDFIFEFDGLNSFEFCSLGQQKMSFMSLLFAYIELFRYKFNSYPIVLIDDVSGELDRKRWQNLIQYLEQKPFQVFITTANDDFRKELEKIPHAKKIFIENGKLHYHG